MSEDEQTSAENSQTDELEAYRAATLHLMRRANVAQYYDRDADPKSLALSEGFAAGFYEAYRTFLLILQAGLGLQEDSDPARSVLDYLVLDQMRGGPANFDLEDTRRFLQRLEDEARQRLQAPPAAEPGEADQPPG